MFPAAPPRKSYLETVLANEQGVFVAVSDNMKIVPDQIAPWVPGGLTTLGTDGFGRSDTRQRLRRFFEVDAELTVIAALYALAERGQIERAVVARAIKDLGVDPEKASGVTLLAENLTDANGRTHGVGALPEYKEIVLGYVLASKLGAYLDTPLMIVTPQMKSGTYMTHPTEMLVKVSGLSQAQMHEFDTVYGFITLETAKKLTGKDGVDGIQLRLNDPFKAKEISERIEAHMPEYTAVTWYESQQAFFDALKEEKVVMFIILLFIILVAAFNITSTLIMVVMEKRRDIGILRTIGVSSGSVLRLFVLEGLYIGLSGTFAGLILGIVLAHNLNAVASFIAWMMGVDLFNSQIYYFDRIPVAIQWMDVAWVTVCAVFLTFLSTIYPAWSASRLDPVDALRYE